MAGPDLYFFVCIAIPFQLLLVFGFLAILKFVFGVSFSSKSGAGKKNSGLSVRNQHNSEIENGSSSTSSYYSNSNSEDSYTDQDYKSWLKEEIARDQKEADDRAADNWDRYEEAKKAQEDAYWEDKRQEDEQRIRDNWNARHGYGDDD